MSGTGGRFRLRLPALAGGLSLAVEPDAIGDDRLSDGRNLWWDRGALRTRPGLFCNSSRCEVLQSLPEGATSTYTYLGMTPTRHTVTVDGTPATVVTEHWYENGDTHTRPLRLEADGRVQPFRDEDGHSMRPFYTANCLTVSYDGGVPLFFTPNGVFTVNGESIDGYWSNVRDWFYVPTLRVGGHGVTSPTQAKVTGTPFEARNLLNPRFSASFTTDGVGIYYFLPFKNLDDEPVTARLTLASGEELSFTVEYDDTTSEAEGGYTLHVHRRGGYVWFTNTAGTPVALPASGVGGDLRIEAGKTDNTGKDKVLNMQFGVWFGGDSSGLWSGTRLFVAGNPAYPHLIHWSDVNNPLYFPADNYAYVGDAGQRITALKRQEDVLVIFKEHELYTAGYESTPVSASEFAEGAVGNVTAATAAFPLTPLSADVGCDAPATIRLCHGRLVWATRAGQVHMLLSKSAYGARNLRILSSAIAPRLYQTSAASWDNASAALYKGWYLLLLGNTIWALNYDSPAFVRYAGYAADKDAAAGLCWFCLDIPLPQVTWHCLAGSENTLTLFGTHRAGRTLTRVHYTLAGEVDCLLTPAGFVSQPIPFFAASRRFHMNESGLFKDITGLYVSLSSAPTTRLSLTLSDGEGGEWHSPTLYAPRGCRLLAGLRRVRRVQLTLSGSGPIALWDGELSGRFTQEVK